MCTKISCKSKKNIQFNFLILIFSYNFNISSLIALVTNVNIKSHIESRTEQGISRLSRIFMNEIFFTCTLPLDESKPSFLVIP